MALEVERCKTVLVGMKTDVRVEHEESSEEARGRARGEDGVIDDFPAGDVLLVGRDVRDGSEGVPIL